MRKHQLAKKRCKKVNHFIGVTKKPESLGCPENAKSLKSQAPQGFSGFLDIENDEMNKKIF